MVRVKSSASPTVERREEIEYADWMGTKHLSASEISTRDEVLAAVTLSEENGRVTLFEGGKFTDNTRNELGGRWFTDKSNP
jgi:DNA integrity scanning protein DisA with diadenylate cyclase activity